MGVSRSLVGVTPLGLLQRGFLGVSLGYNVAPLCFPRSVLRVNVGSGGWYRIGHTPQGSQPCGWCKDRLEDLNSRSSDGESGCWKLGTRSPGLSPFLGITFLHGSSRKFQYTEVGYKDKVEDGQRSLWMTGEWSC